MRHENFDIQKVIEYLQGTTNTLSDAIEELYPGMDEDELMDEEFNRIDDEIFLCETCGWWCEIHEEADNVEGYHEKICQECYDEQNQDEE